MADKEPAGKKAPTARPERMSIRTIARAANVSITTVSRTINGVATVNAQMLIHTSQRTPGLPPMRASSVAAASTSEFLDSIGVACHLNYTWTPYKDFQTTKALLVASGIRNIRDGGADPPAIARLRAIRAAGIGVTWVLDSIEGVAPTAAYWTTPPHDTLTHFLKDVLGVAVADNIEVGNEIDIFYANKHWHTHDSSPERNR